MKIDLRQEANEFRKWLEQKVVAATTALAKKGKGPSKSVSAIVALHCYVQDGWIAIDFNTDKEFEYNGDVSKASWKDLFARPVWQAFCESEDSTLTFVQIDGSSNSMLQAEMTDEFLSGHFGKMIADVLAAAWGNGMFSVLPFQPGCVILIDDFNGNWPCRELVSFPNRQRGHRQAGFPGRRLVLLLRLDRPQPHVVLHRPETHLDPVQPYPSPDQTPWDRPSSLWTNRTPRF